MKAVTPFNEGIHEGLVALGYHFEHYFSVANDPEEQSYMKDNFRIWVGPDGNVIDWENV